MNRAAINRLAKVIYDAWCDANVAESAKSGIVWHVVSWDNLMSCYKTVWRKTAKAALLAMNKDRES